MKLLNGAELASYIKERQAKQVRALRQADGTAPKLAIVVTVDHPAINIYMRMKSRYGDDVLIDVDIHKIDQAEAVATIEQLNNDPSVHGIIVQLPLADPSQTQEIVDLVAPEKDVDALGVNAVFEPATPLAIMWLLAGYNINLPGKNIALVGRGRLVGAPLERLMQASGLEPTVIDSQTKNTSEILQDADIVITATGKPGLIKESDIKYGAVVVDAGVAGEQGKTVGDLDEAIYQRDDLTITPKKGGVGPLTICALFDNVIRAARDTVTRP
ncbi:MAG: bifunctional 5,10-methylenetetrahydrofolate dehydrogenase/5,10-methenyltetrahydrofolate [Candidatus Saccharibacteria bacterium]|nr:bifunctional 5,10-methylenetetrahydrofolate dehydrogenase/5,10-methenyltetrahydrofolate [Candidatus Saccharibacteria bacterium]